MSLLIQLDPSPSFEPKQRKPAADRLIEGDPCFKTWPADASCGDRVQTGIWEASPGTYRAVRGETFEFCHLLQGLIELTEEGQEPRIFKAGDSFLMKPGFVGVWKTIESVRKIYVVVSP